MCIVNSCVLCVCEIYEKVQIRSLYLVHNLDLSENEARRKITAVCCSRLDTWSMLPTPEEITYLLTTWSTVLLDKLTGSQLVKEFPAFYGTRMFITAFTSARHLSLSRAEVSVQVRGSLY